MPDLRLLGAMRACLTPSLCWLSLGFSLIPNHGGGCSPRFSFLLPVPQTDAGRYTIFCSTLIVKLFRIDCTQLSPDVLSDGLGANFRLSLAAVTWHDGLDQCKVG